MDDSGDFLRQRRNLVTLSAGLIVFILAEGHFKSAGGVLAFPVRFDNPSIIYYVLWVLLLYFLWRYWLFGGKSAYDRTRSEMLKWLKQDAFYHKKVLRKYREDIENEAAKNIHVPENDTGEFSMATPEIEEIDKKKHRLRARFPIEAKYKGSKSNFILPRDLKFFSFAWWYVIKNFVKSAYHTGAFSDYVLPYLLCDIAAIMGAYSAYLKAEALHL